MKPQSLDDIRGMPLGTKVRFVGKSLYVNPDGPIFEDLDLDDDLSRRQWFGCVLLKIDEERREYLFSLGASISQDSSLSECVESKETRGIFSISFDITHLQVIPQETLTREELLTHHHQAVRALGASL